MGGRSRASGSSGTTRRQSAAVQGVAPVSGAGGPTQQDDGNTAQSSTSNGFSGTVDGKDISGSWIPPTSTARGADIESVMDAQGFRGMPKLISDQAEFDKAAQAAWGGNGMVMVRGIGASDQFTLDAYSDSLTNGEWYVTCGGGAAHGYGQYAAYRYGSTKPRRSDVNEAMGYGSYYGDHTKVFTMTLDPSAKIGEESKLRDSMRDHNRNAVKNSSAVGNEINRILNKSLVTYGERQAIRDAQWGDLKPRSAYATNAKSYNRTMKRLQAALRSEGKTAFTDVGVFAAARGYDFYYDRNTGYSVTLNRTKLIIKV